MPGFAAVPVYRFLALPLLLLSAMATPAQASPIVYKLVVFVDPREAPAPAPISGSVGPRSFGGAGHDVVMTYTLESDTSDVVNFTAPVAGAENLTGTASFQINRAGTGTLVAKGTFQPGAGVYVSVDHANHGLGFGSSGAQPGTAQFPGNPVYPYAANFVYNGTYPDYDLVQPADILLYNNVSCVGFPGACSAGAALASSAGDLVVNPVNGDGFGLFFAAPKLVSFASFDAPTRLSTSGRLHMRGRFTLGDGNDGIDPPNEDVTLKIIDSFGASLPDLTIPAGSFRHPSAGQFEYGGTVDGVQLKIVIRRVSSGHYQFEVGGGGVALADAYAGKAPIAVTLLIGDDLGTTTATKP
jgi:hypothetical protein